jgi:pantetheine-phosphate adenylyltransferase
VDLVEKALRETDCDDLLDAFEARSTERAAMVAVARSPGETPFRSGERVSARATRGGSGSRRSGEGRASRLRITGGELGGLRLRIPADAGVRPTSDRVRESLFARLTELRGARVLDLFAGSGALGIEALSRGAKGVVFVDRSPSCVTALQENLSAHGLEERGRVVRADGCAALRRLAREGSRFDLVLLDPPYESSEVDRVLPALVAGELLTPSGMVVVETAKRHPVRIVDGLQILDERDYGDTRITRLVSSDSEVASNGPSVGHAAERAPKRGTSPAMTAAPRTDSIALFPASFDPLTNGHLDLLDRARRVFPQVVVALASNVDKRGGTFSFAERMEILNDVLGNEEGVRIDSFDCLVVDYARQIGASAIVRGLRMLSDFEYEFEMALMNRHMNSEVETLFMMASQEYLYVSSSRLKELVTFGTSVDEFVPAIVAERLRKKLCND